MRVALVQHASGLEPADNRDLLEELTPEGVDLTVFPEAFARDFGKPGSDVSGFAEPLDGPFATELERVAQARDATLLAGLFETSEDLQRPFNTLVLRGRARADYRKVHLYDSFGYRESDRLTAGPISAPVVELGGLAVGLMTCYDLRFPEQSRALVDAGAEVLVIPAAWVAGERKVDHWRTLVRARAIENTVYVVAVGQPAPRYTGHSMVVDPLGDVIAEAGEEPAVLTATLEREVLVEARRTNPSLANRRR
ncbi:carbon-nitrogen hydrolase family protein [Nocardioides coralli]|nr:carbon-nitrogen hydrolase family protein [Nocardioides coralli]